MKIRAHPGLCQGHGVCRRFAPAVYPLDDEGYLDLHLAEVPPELEAAAVLGASVCPAHVITIIEDRSSLAARAEPVERDCE
jgi:ferredoxin